MNAIIAIGLLVLLSVFQVAGAAILKVGPQRVLLMPSQAASIAQDGDIIEIDAGDYLRDAAVWRANKLVIRGVGGKARLLSDGVTVEGKAIWVIKGANVTVENIEFADARVISRNGAGIRMEGADLTIRNCLFRDNENGILTGANIFSTLTVENCTFDQNGYGDGFSHNIYVGALGQFVLRNSVIRRARIGHQVKSRAADNIIENNRIEDGPDGRSSYLIDLPAGGRALIVRNWLHQGPRAENGTMFAYGAEGSAHAVNEVVMQNNVFVNDRPHGCRLVWIRRAGIKSNISDNQFFGCERIDGADSMSGNVASARSRLSVTAEANSKAPVLPVGAEQNNQGK